MRIAYLNNFFLPRASGSAHLTAELSRRLAAAGHQVLVITATYGDAPLFEESAGYRVVRIPCLTLPQLKLAFNFDVNTTAAPANLRRVFRLLDEFGPDIVHGHGQFFDLTVMGSLWARRRKVPMAISVHTRLEHPARAANLLLNAIDRTAIRTATRWADPWVVVMDRLMHSYIRSRYSIRPERLVPIPVGVDVDRFAAANATARRAVRERLGLPRDARIILSVGHVIAIRNRLTLVDALPEILRAEPAARLVVVGTVYDDRFLQRARALGVEHAIISTGKADKDDIPDYVAAADIEAHDLEGIGLGTASLEVMAAGVPTIAAVRDDNFLGLTLRNWHDLVLVEPDRADQLAAAVLRLFGDRELAAELGENQRKLVDAHFSMSSVTDAHLELYRNAIRSGR